LSRTASIADRALVDAAQSFQAELAEMDRRRPEEERLRREWKAWSEADSRAFLESLVRRSEERNPTFRKHHMEARARHGLT
jgi:hypothetical protein